jgi:hypothetical protein
MIRHRAIATWAVVSTAAAAAMAGCGSSHTGTGASTSGWSCGAVSVPFGSTYQCASADPQVFSAASALGTTYTCTAGAPTTACPPAEDAPPPPPAEDGPPPATDAGTPGEDASSPESDASSPPVEDSGSPSNSPPGHGPPAMDAGKGHGGNPHPNPPGGSCGCDAGEGTDAGEDTPPPPPYDCETEEAANLAVCNQPPTCNEGSHPSACGACVPDDTTEDCQPPSSGGCWVTGGGTIPLGSSDDSFGGNAMPMKSGTIRGEWENVDHVTGVQMHGEPTYLYCRQVDEPGPGADNGPHHDFTINQAYFGGPARVFANGAWDTTYWFDVVVDDHGEGKGAKAGGPDLYHVTIRQLAGANSSGPILLDANADMSGGNIQIHPPNNGHPYSASTLPTWVSLQP